MAGDRQNFKKKSLLLSIAACGSDAQWIPLIKENFSKFEQAYCWAFANFLLLIVVNFLLSNMMKPDEHTQLFVLPNLNSI